MEARVRLEAYQIEQIPASRVPNLGWFLDPAARRVVMCCPNHCVPTVTIICVSRPVFTSVADMQDPAVSPSAGENKLRNLAHEQVRTAAVGGLVEIHLFVPRPVQRRGAWLARFKTLAEEPDGCRITYPPFQQAFHVEGNFRGPGVSPRPRLYATHWRGQAINKLTGMLGRTRRVHLATIIRFWLEIDTHRRGKAGRGPPVSKHGHPEVNPRRLSKQMHCLQRAQ